MRQRRDGRPGRRGWPRAAAAAAVAAVAAVMAASVVGLSGCGSDGVGRLDPGDGAAAAGVGVTVVPADERVAAPPFAGPVLGDPGRETSLAERRGQVVVLNVWGSWCAPCRAEAPVLQTLSTELAPRGVTFLGVNTRDSDAGAKGFLAEFGITYPSIVDTSGEQLLAFRDTLPPAAIPATLIIDTQGRVAARALGEISETSLRQLVEDVLGPATPATPAAPAAGATPATDAPATDAPATDAPATAAAALRPPAVPA